MLRRLFGSRTPSATERPPIERLDISFAGVERSVVVRRNVKAQRYILRVRPATHEVVLTMPVRGNMAAAKAFLRRYEGWIETRLKSLPERVAFTDGAIVPLRGELHRIVHQTGRRGLTRIERDEAGYPVIAVTGDAEHCPRRVRDFLKRSAKADLEAATRLYAEQLDVSVKRIAIKDTTSRWGSCSSQGAIAYSWRIIMAPPFVLDYLAAHEVAHRREMNHSPRFWAIVRKVCEQTDAAEAWLKKNGSGLHRFG